MSNIDQSNWTATYDKSPMRRIEQAKMEEQATRTPYRALHIIPRVICKDCVHMKWSDDCSPCLAGATTTSPVTGHVSYDERCDARNKDGECQDFLAIDREAQAKEQLRQNLILVGVLMLFLGGVAGLILSRGGF
jgi:hypothetical protein